MVELSYRGFTQTELNAAVSKRLVFWLDGSGNKNYVTTLSGFWSELKVYGGAAPNDTTTQRIQAALNMYIDGVEESRRTIVAVTGQTAGINELPPVISTPDYPSATNNIQTENLFVSNTQYLENIGVYEPQATTTTTTTTTEIPAMYSIDIRTWIPLPQSLETPIMQALIANETKWGYTFWNVNIHDDVLHIEYTKNGSISLALLIACIIAAVALIVGVVMIVRSVTLKQIWDDKVVIQELQTQEISAVEQTKQKILSSDLSSTEKADLLSQYDAYYQSLLESRKEETPTTDNTMGDLKTMLLYGVAAAIIISAVKK